ncbi:MAG: helix-turn-helix transcriptional regulator [Lachnospiraceae bacterium]|nr:helix-turn-helix transcriptional regulator [Lachnospiraceae bacterium]
MKEEPEEKYKTIQNTKRVPGSRQRKLADGIRQYLMANLDRKVTITELADYFHVSETLIKNCFKGVYGTTVHAWFRTEKMKAAAQDLVTTDLSVLEIAGKYGFDNGSKFAKAFSGVFSLPPSEFRLTKISRN